METTVPSFFDGLPMQELAPLVDRLERRSFPLGATVLAEGDFVHEMYVIQSGTAEVVMSDRHGAEHRVNAVGPGAAVGEMGLLTEQPASATVRATTDLEALVLSEAEFQEITARFPRIYRNIGAMLAQRLVRSNLRELQGARRLTVLRDAGAPPLLGYALACSIAWHTRKPTLLVVLIGHKPPVELALLATASPPPRVRSPYTSTTLGRDKARARAYVLLTPPTGVFAPESLADALEDLSSRYEHVLLQTSADLPVGALASRSVVLAPPGTPRPAGDTYAICGWADADLVATTSPDRDGLVAVPALAGADEPWLATGVLPASSVAGRALGWAARDLADLAVGLALGGGSERGYAHIGVWRGLNRLGIPVDYLAGTSIGSAVAALYALGYDPERAAEVLDRLGPTAFRFTVSTASLLSSAGLRAGIEAVGGDTRIEDLRLPLAITAADIISRREVVFKRGLLGSAVLASMSIPGFFPPQAMGPCLLVDGGVLNPVPGNLVGEMGADKILAVRLATRPNLPELALEAIPAGGRLPSVVHTVMRSFDMMQSNIAVNTAGATTIVIDPSFAESEHLGLRRWREARRYIEVGEAAAEAAVPRIATALPWLREFAPGEVA